MGTYEGMSDLSNGVVRALVVDDQPAVVRTVVRWLEGEGIECVGAYSGEQALSLFEPGRYGLVLTDIHMPGGSGLELAGTIRSMDPLVQVIIMTGNTGVETAVEALRLHADDYLVKPFQSAGLLHATRRAVEHRNLLLENRRYRNHLEDQVRLQTHRIERLYLSSIHALVRALEAKDAHTRGHSDRVTDYALLIQQEVGGVDPESLRVGAQLHDIGKIGIRGEILRKEGPLDGLELGHVRDHPRIGVEILSPLLDDPVALGVVRHHHERWDGRGYPDGLAGENIPVGARIVAIADSFDAMTSLRPYRPALSAVAAIAELNREAGRQFDPTLVPLASRALAAPLAALA